MLERLAADVRRQLAFELEYFPWGSRVLPASTAACWPTTRSSDSRRFDAIYFGAVGWPSVPDHITLWGLRLAICQGFDQWANMRPVRFCQGVPSRLRRRATRRLDWVVVRENSEGEYAGIGGRNLAARGPGTRSRSRPRCSPRRAASGSCASPSSSPARVRAAR